MLILKIVIKVLKGGNSSSLNYGVQKSIRQTYFEIHLAKKLQKFNYLGMKSLLFYTLISLLIASCIDLAPYKNKAEIIENMSKSLQMKYPHIETLSARQVFNKIESKSFDYLLVDIRSQEHIKLSIIPGAVSLNQFLTAKNNFKDKLIILYSTIGLGANEVASQLNNDGFHSVILRGGTLAWAQENFDFIHGNNPTKEIFIENEAWNLLPDNYKGVLP